MDGGEYETACGGVHSATMAGSVMVVSFGKAGGGVGGVGEGQSFLKGDGVAGQMHYLDTATMQNGGGLTWSTSTEGVEKARQAVAAAGGAATSASAPPAQCLRLLPCRHQPPLVFDTITARGRISSSVQHPRPNPLPTNVESTPPTDASQTTPPTPNSKHTGVIAGTLLGAAALAAALGGIYAYRKRKEAAAYNEGRLDEEKHARVRTSPT